MSEHIFWLLQLKIKPGELDNARALMEEMVEATQANEPDTVNYEWFISDDEQTCHIYERYRHLAAVLTHRETYRQKFAGRFMAVFEPTRLTIYGEPNDETKKAVSGMGGVFMAPFGGFAR